jgi:hypothetical protein
MTKNVNNIINALPIERQQKIDVRVEELRTEYLAMIKQTAQYSSPLDTLVAIAKRLSLYEQEKKMSSEDFFAQYMSGELSEDLTFIEWANDYRHYLALHQEIQQKLSYAA